MYHDLLGMAPADRQAPKFVRRYADLEALSTAAVARFVDDVHEGRFPSSAETYHMTDQMAEAFGPESAASSGDEAVTDGESAQPSLPAQ